MKACSYQFTAETNIETTEPTFLSVKASEPAFSQFLHWMQILCADLHVMVSQYRDGKGTDKEGNTGREVIRQKRA